MIPVMHSRRGSAIDWRWNDHRCGPHDYGRGGWGRSHNHGGGLDNDWRRGGLDDDWRRGGLDNHGCGLRRRHDHGCGLRCNDDIRLVQCSNDIGDGVDDIKCSVESRMTGVAVMVAMTARARSMMMPRVCGGANCDDYDDCDCFQCFLHDVFSFLYCLVEK